MSIPATQQHLSEWLRMARPNGSWEVDRVRWAVSSVQRCLPISWGHVSWFGGVTVLKRSTTPPSGDHSLVARSRMRRYVLYTLYSGSHGQDVFVKLRSHIKYPRILRGREPGMGLIVGNKPGLHVMVCGQQDAIFCFLLFPLYDGPTHTQDPVIIIEHR